jgi:hypothetical protein
MAARFYVLFTSSFRYEAAPHISHETVDKQRTLCGRKVSDAATFEPDSNGRSGARGVRQDTNLDHYRHRARSRDVSAISIRVG